MHDVGVGDDVGDKAVAYFSRALMSNSTVTSLCLRGLFHCYLSAVMCVHNISKDKCCILTTADNISDYGMTDLSEGLTKNSTLSVLDLGGSCYIHNRSFGGGAERDGGNFLGGGNDVTFQ